MASPVSVSHTCKRKPLCTLRTANRSAGLTLPHAAQSFVKRVSVISRYGKNCDTCTLQKEGAAQAESRGGHQEHAPGRGRGDTRRCGQKRLDEHYPSRERKRRTACSKSGTARALLGALAPNAQARGGWGTISTPRHRGEPLRALSREARATEARVLATLGRGRKRGGGRAAQPSEAGTPGTRRRRSTRPVHSTRCEESLFTRQCAPSAPTSHLQVFGALLKELAAARLLLKLLL